MVFLSSLDVKVIVNSVAFHSNLLGLGHLELVGDNGSRGDSELRLGV
jgi:hypothetical protein